MLNGSDNATKKVQRYHFKIIVMKRLKQQVLWGVAIVIIALFAGVVGFAGGVLFVGVIGLCIAAGCLTGIYFAVRDYNFYRDMTVRMQNLTVHEKIDIIYENVELWMQYASEEDVNELRHYFRVMSPEQPDYKRLEYLLERAEVYRK